MQKQALRIIATVVLMKADKTNQMKFGASLYSHIYLIWQGIQIHITHPS